MGACSHSSGTYETFRPYAGWLAEVEEKMRNRYNTGSPLAPNHTDIANTRIKPD